MDFLIMVLGYIIAGLAAPFVFVFDMLYFAFEAAHDHLEDWRQ